MAPAWGQVSVADPGDFGSVTITTAMTIDGGNSNVLIDNCTITGLGGAIAAVGNAGNSIQVSGSTISNTFDALSYAVGTSLISNGNNTFFNNVSLKTASQKPSSCSRPETPTPTRDAEDQGFLGEY